MAQRRLGSTWHLPVVCAELAQSQPFYGERLLDEFRPRLEPAQEVQEPPPPEDEPEIEEVPARALDPALLYFIILAITLLGLNGIAPDVRYVAVWSVLTILAVVFIMADKVSIEPPTLRDIIIGAGFGVLVVSSRFSGCTRGYLCGIGGRHLVARAVLPAIECVPVSIGGVCDRAGVSVRQRAVQLCPPTFWLIRQLDLSDRDQLTAVVCRALCVITPGSRNP